MARIKTWVTTTREDVGSHKVVRMVPPDEAAVKAGGDMGRCCCAPSLRVCR